MEITPKILERFWAKVNKNGPPPIGKNCLGCCWLWTASIRAKNAPYGCFSIRGKTVNAHRVSWWIAFGDPKALDVLHHCDNMLCVNPEHLFLGTDADNTKDKCAKGRQSRTHGEDCGGSKLTTANVLEIRQRLAAGEGQRLLAKLYDVSHKTISKIYLRQRWTHV